MTTQNNTELMSGDEIAAWEHKLEAYVKQIETVDAGHDISHIKRVVKSAKQFCLAEQANMWVVLPAAWLHDCVQVAKDSAMRSKASELAADKAIEILANWQYPDQFFTAIHHAIMAHSYSANITCQTLEAMVVQDADRMDALGAIGICRTLLVGAGFGNPLTFHEDPFCYDRKPDDQAAIMDHFYTKLLKLKDSFQTQAGRKEAASRDAYMRGFLQQLEQEII